VVLRSGRRVRATWASSSAEEALVVNAGLDRDTLWELALAARAPSIYLSRVER
jgi:hypothetical protein